LEHRYKKARDPVERSHLQIVWLLSEGRTTEEVCRVTGYSPGWVRRLARRYNERGVWSGPKVARWIAQRNGLEKVHAQRGFEYLRKVGMSPQVPRPANAKGASPSEREVFKKVSR